ncbi:MAG: 2-dehydropantoate 2-reductase N-terminal domain-containing protein, partial [Candidatus Riflebacteria bacterium]
MNFAVLGAGSWGTTLANLLCENGHRVKIWAREPEVVDGINRHRKNPYFVSHLNLSNSLEAVSSIDQALDQVEFALTSIPSGFIRETLAPYACKLSS